MADNWMSKKKIFLAARPFLIPGHHYDLQDRAGVVDFLYENNADLDTIVKEYGEATVIDILVGLYRRGLFSSETKAKLEFPDLFLTTTERHMLRQSSNRQAQAAEKGAMAQAEAENTTTAIYLGTDSTNPGIQVKKPREKGAKLSLFPLYLSYTCQHSLLNYAQSLLEECCFQFAQRYLPKVVRSESWDCAEAVELNRWIEVLAYNFSSIPNTATTVHTAEGLRELVLETAQIRHAAVHRLPMHAEKIRAMLHSAAELAIALKNTRIAHKLEMLQESFLSVKSDMEIHKNNLEHDFDERFSQIQRQRQKLDEVERQLKNDILAQDKDITDRICRVLKRSVEHMKLDDYSLDDEKTADGSPVGVINMPDARADIPAPLESPLENWHSEAFGPEILSQNEIN